MPRVLFCGPLILLEKCGCYFTRIRKLVYGLNMANQGSLHQSFESLRVFSQNLSNNQNILPSCVNKIVEVRPFRLNSGFEMTTSESNQYFKIFCFLAYYEVPIIRVYIFILKFKPPPIKQAYLILHVY